MPFVAFLSFRNKRSLFTLSFYMQNIARCTRWALIETWALTGMNIRNKHSSYNECDMHWDMHCANA